MDFTNELINYIFKYHNIIQIKGETPNDVYNIAASGMSELQHFLLPKAMDYFPNVEYDPNGRPHPYHGHYVETWLRMMLTVPPVQVFDMSLLCSYMWELPLRLDKNCNEVLKKKMYTNKTINV